MNAGQLGCPGGIYMSSNWKKNSNWARKREDQGSEERKWSDEIETLIELSEKRVLWVNNDYGEIYHKLESYFAVVDFFSFSSMRQRETTAVSRSIGIRLYQWSTICIKNCQYFSFGCWTCSSLCIIIQQWILELSWQLWTQFMQFGLPPWTTPLQIPRCPPHTYETKLQRLVHFVN